MGYKHEQKLLTEVPVGGRFLTKIDLEHRRFYVFLKHYDYLAQQVKDCAHGFIQAMLEHELLSIYIEAVDGNPDDLVMTSELKLVKPRYDDDPRNRALTGTLPMDDHPYRVFPQQ